MGLLDDIRDSLRGIGPNLRGEDTPQTPAFEAQRDADVAGFNTQRMLANQLVQAIVQAGGSDSLESVLRSRGRISTENRDRLNKALLREQKGISENLAGRSAEQGLGEESNAAIKDAVSGSFRTRTGKRRARLAQEQEARQRDELANIFGRNLAQTVAAGTQTTGAVEPKEPKRSGADRFFLGVQRAFGDLFGGGQ